MSRKNLTYDVVFYDSETCDSKGFHETFEYCMQYIRQYNGTGHSYFADYKGGAVSVMCNETGYFVYHEEIF